MQLQQLQPTLDALDVQVAVVTFELNVVAENYLRSTQLPWPFLIDNDRTLYRQYGMQSGTWWNLAGPAVILAYFKLFAHGRWLKKTTGDVKQLGGDIVIDPNSKVQFHYVGEGPADRPPLSDLVAVVKDRQAAAE